MRTTCVQFIGELSSPWDANSVHANRCARFWGAPFDWSARIKFQNLKEFQQKLCGHKKRSLINSRALCIKLNIQQILIFNIHSVVWIKAKPPNFSTKMNYPYPFSLSTILILAQILIFICLQFLPHMLWTHILKLKLCILSVDLATDF